jgi:hypothetical protein
MFYKDYVWKNGKPYGIKPFSPEKEESSYKIIADPYYKRISIEKYRGNALDKCVYDSFLLDFRHLTLKDQMAWQREIVEETENQQICLVRDQNDRILFMETLFYGDEQCRKCVVSSVHGILLAVHCLFYEHLQDEFNGIILYDSENRLVMEKEYEWDSERGEFTTLVSESWVPIGQ